MKMLKTGIALIAAGAFLAGCSVFQGGGDRKPKTPTVGERIPILTAELGAEADPALAGVSVLLPPAETNAEWSQPGGNGSKSMGHLALGNSIGKAWDARIRGTTKYERLAASPVVAEGKLFVVDTFAMLYAFDAATGRELWRAQVGDPADVKGGRSIWTGEMTGDKGSLFGGGVSYDGGNVYATNGLGDVSAHEAATGKRLWKVRPGGPLRGAPAIGNGLVYAMSQDNQLFALNQADGSVQWTQSSGLELAGIFGAAAPAVGQGTVVVGFSSGELTAYRYENGRALWSDALSRTSISTSVARLADIDASPVIDRGRVFAIGQGGRMISMDLVTGQRLWEVNLGGIAQPWVAGEWLFVIDERARLLCVSRTSGKVRWISQLPGYRSQKKKKGQIFWYGPVAAGNRLIAVSTEGQLANIDVETGKIQNATDAGGPVHLSPIVAGNTLYILSDDGRISAWR